jgi:transposase
LPPPLLRLSGARGDGIMAEYTEGFRRRMVERMTAPGAISATALAAEVGVTQPTLSRWLREAANVDDVARSKKTKTGAPDANTPRRHASAWSAEEKFAAVLEAAAVSDSALGGWLRAKGLHEEDLVRFRDEVRSAALAGMRPSTKPTKESAGDRKRIKELERELKRSNAALAETAAILVLRKKAVALWGEEGDDT